MNDLPIVSGVQARALEALATYWFLTVELMQLAGVGRDRKNLQAALDALVRKKWIGRTELRTSPGAGRLPRLYFLREAGAEAMADLFGGEPSLAIKKKKPMLADELPHRLAIIETHIRLLQWAEAAGVTLDWFVADYGPGRTRDLKATGIRYELDGEAETFTPDGIARVTLADGLPRLLVIEVYQGGRNRSLKHYREQLPVLLKVCRDELVENHHGSEDAARFLILFADADMHEKATRVWPGAADDLAGQFFTKAMPELGAGDFSGEWARPGQPERRPLF